jgi:tRNA-dihydrouridine synthase
MVQHTGIKGVMVAQGLLENPTLFAGYQSTPASCVQEVAYLVYILVCRCFISIWNKSLYISSSFIIHASI